jgi:hypothetical protein
MAEQATSVVQIINKQIDEALSELTEAHHLSMNSNDGTHRRACVSEMFTKIGEVSALVETLHRIGILPEETLKIRRKRSQFRRAAESIL